MGIWEIAVGRIFPSAPPIRFDRLNVTVPHSGFGAGCGNAFAVRREFSAGVDHQVAALANYGDLPLRGPAKIWISGNRRPG